MRQAAVASGRDPEGIVFSAVSSAITGETEAEYRTALARAAEDRGVEPSALEARIAEAGTLHGPRDQILEQIAAAERIGIAKLYLQFFSMPTIDEVAAVWAAVRPA